MVFPGELGCNPYVFWFWAARVDLYGSDALARSESACMLLLVSVSVLVPPAASGLPLSRVKHTSFLLESGISFSQVRKAADLLWPVQSIFASMIVLKFLALC